MLRSTLIAAVVACAAVAACGRDETLRAYGAAGRNWQLVSLDGTTVSAPSALHFPATGMIAGQTPCRRFQARQSAPYPWFEVQGLPSPDPDCPEAAAEGAFLSALKDMTLAEVAGDVMILSTGAGREMLFTAGG